MIFSSRWFSGISLCLVLLSSLPSLAQPEVQAWGNLRGIRVGGQLMRFESSFRYVEADWQHERATAQERNWTTYRRTAEGQIVRTRLDSLFITQTVRDAGKGKASISLELDPHQAQGLVGVFFHLRLPAAEYGGADLQLLEPAPLKLAGELPGLTAEYEYLRATAQGISLNAPNRQLQVRLEEAVEIIVSKDPQSDDLGIYFTLAAGQLPVGESISHQISLSVSGTPDTETAHLKLYPDYPGNEFLGLGGNFRLQNPRFDPPVIDYCLENIDVRMGRVEFPWRYWHEYDSINPLAAARKGDIHPRAQAAMEMAQRLYQMGMPVLLAGWFPPPWAAEGEVSWQARNPDGSYGNSLNQARIEDIYASITDYLIYLKEAYGVEIEMFSFNESDLGINVRQTAEEHAALIKGLGAYMKARGLKTKLLLGDTADANGFAFVDASLDDPETWQYIGAVSFHSWRGWKKETLLEWFEAADRINVPLIIGEGSIDAAAWRYRGIFEEAHYAMEEIKLYTRILAICQPQSILQWQLTSDYSPLAGGGMNGNDSMALFPTQRFWNLKQLASTPAGLASLPLTCDNPELFVAALGDADRDEYTFHLVNDGPARKVVLSGLPKGLKRLRLYFTDADHHMEQGERIKVKNGEARFSISAAGFTSLMSE